MSSLDRVPGAGLLVDESLTITEGNRRCRVVFEQELDSLRGETLETLQERGFFDEQSHRTWTELVTSVLDGASEASGQLTLSPAGSDETYGYALRVTPGETDETVVCSLRSVGTTEYEQTLTSLHAATRELMTADDVEAVLTRTAVAATEVLGFPGTAVWKHDPVAGMLRHVGGRVENSDSRPPVPIDESPHGRALRREETVIDDLDAADDSDPFTQRLHVPIGTTGLLSLGTVGSAFDETAVHLAEILADNATAAATAVETTASVREERERLDQFTSVVSHDLRNPLGIARTYLDFAEDTGEAADFATVHEALDRMDEMIEDLLTVARMERTITDAEGVELEPLVDQTWGLTPTGDATLRTQLPDGYSVTGDENLLGTVFENCFRNAVDHNDDPVTVTVGTLESGFYIEDDGVGISEDQRDRIFECAVTTSDEGTGFGLPIVEGIVDAHGWSITVTDSDDGGARFEIRT